jgi:hypothetical protein
LKPVSLRIRAPLLVGVALVLLASLIFGSTTWQQPASSADPVSRATVGPFAAGESFGQRFTSEISYLSRVVVRVRAREGDGAPVVAKLNFRLFRGDDLVREGQVPIPGLPESSHPVSWSFSPLAESAGSEYELQVVVTDISSGRLVADATTADTLPGPIITNGIPGGEHTDLVLRPFRELRRTGVLLAIGDSVPGGRTGMVFLLGAASAIGGLGLHALRRGHGGSGPVDLLVWAFLGVAIVSLASSVPLTQFRAVMAAEDDPGFIFATRGMALGVALAPWVIFLAARATGRLAELRASELGGRLFIAAVTTTAIGLLLLVITEEPFYFQWIEMVEGGRPEQGRIPLLQQIGSASFLRVSMAAWIAAWLFSLGRGGSPSTPPPRIR